MHKSLKQILACGLSITCILAGMNTNTFVDASESNDTKGNVEVTKEVPSSNPSFCSGVPVVTVPPIMETEMPTEPTLTPISSKQVTQPPKNQLLQKIELEDNVTIERVSDVKITISFKNSTFFSYLNFTREYPTGEKESKYYGMHRGGDTWSVDFSYEKEGTKFTICITYSAAKNAFGTQMKATKPITFVYNKDGIKVVDTDTSGLKLNMPETTETFKPEPIETVKPDPSETFKPEPSKDISKRPYQPQMINEIGNVAYYYRMEYTMGRVHLEMPALAATMFYTLDLGKTWRADTMYTREDSSYTILSHKYTPVGVSFLYVDLNGRWHYYGPYFFQRNLAFQTCTGGVFEPKTYDTYYDGCLLPTTDDKTVQELVPIYNWDGTDPIQIKPSVTPTGTGPRPTVSGPEPTTKNNDVKAECQYNGDCSGCINENFVVTSTGKKDICLSKLKIRQYYSFDGNLTQTFTCNHAGLQLNVAPYYEDLTSKVKGEFKDGYVEISFNSDELLTVGNSSFKISALLNQKDWVSYNGFKNEKIELYYDDVKLEV